MKKKKKKNNKWNIILHPKWPINLAGVFVLTRIRSRVNRNPFIEENSSAIDPRERERERESTIAWTLTAPYGRCTTFNPPLMKEAIRVHVANVAQHVPRSTRAYIVWIRVCVCVCVCVCVYRAHGSVHSQTRNFLKQARSSHLVAMTTSIFIHNE